MRHYDIYHCMARRTGNISFSPTDLRLLRIFQAVVRHEGFAAAQGELGLTPGTISNHITHLETRFGVRLCERGRRGFSLTPDGSRIHEAAESLLRSAENFAGIVGSVRGELAGTIHLGTVDAMHTNREAPLDLAIARFSELAPKVTLHVEIASPQDLLQRLLDGRYTVILTPTADLHPSVVSQALYEEEQRLYCGRDNPLYAVAENTSLETVRQQPYVGRTYMHGLDRDRDSGFEHRAMTSHMEAIAILIKSGRYLGYLPVHFAQSFVDQKEMKSLLDEQLSYNDTFHLALRKDEKNRAALLLSRCLKETLGVADRPS
jgi:LysR family transcriptional regulator, transcriptional activator for bauABCD operon